MSRAGPHHPWLARPSWSDVERELAELLELARVHLDLDVAFIARFDGPDRTIAIVAAGHPATITRLTGARAPRPGTHCDLVANGEVAAVVPDVRHVPRLAGLADADRLGARSLVGVPVVGSDGVVWGTVCAFGTEPAPDLDDGHAGILRFVADLVATRVAVVRRVRSEQEDAAATIDALIEQGEPSMVGQPIVRLADDTVVGVEALARFPDGRPDELFALAALGQRSMELELAAVAAAVASVPHLPDDAWLSCNVSLRTATDRRFVRTIEDVDPHRLVLEVTEDGQPDDERAAAAGLTRSRRHGVRIAMDDIGTGWSGLRRALRLEPEILKLDRELINRVHVDTSKQALVGAICAFAAAVGATVVAEGIEVAEERATLRELGVPLGQGWLLGRPRPFDELRRDPDVVG